jgi:hypothetical protein
MIDTIKVLFCLFFLISFMRTSSSQDSLAVNQSIRDGQTLVSANGTFQMGFLIPGNSKVRYLGMSYKNLTPLTAVWVANREAPVRNNSGVLKLNENGVLVILNSTNIIVWLSNISNKVDNGSIMAQLMDTGNLVLKMGQDSRNEENILWQSFDYPCDTFMPGMKIGWNLVTDLNRMQSSWKRTADPAKGEFTTNIDLRGHPQAVIKKGSAIKLRIGSWNGRSFIGYPT